MAICFELVVNFGENAEAAREAALTPALMPGARGRQAGRAQRRRAAACICRLHRRSRAAVERPSGPGAERRE